MRYAWAVSALGLLAAVGWARDAQGQSGSPAAVELKQNYPNPFNPSTKIRFALPTSGFVSIKLYDVLGKEVAVLVNENLTAGIKESLEAFAKRRPPRPNHPQDI